jgi:hypothetical protein
MEAEWPASRRWQELDSRLRRVPATPESIALLRDLSLTAEESAWARPAMRSLFQDTLEAGIPDRFLHDLRELSVAVEKVEVEPPSRDRRAPDPLEKPTRSGGFVSLPATPAVWFARWVAIAQPLGPHWTRLRPVLRDLAREVPIVPDEPEDAVAPDLPMRSFVALLESLVESDPDRSEAPLPQVGSPYDVVSTAWVDLLDSVPNGPLEEAFTGRTVTFPDGVDLRFDRFPSVGELRWGASGARLRFESEDRWTVPAPVAACLGSYLVAARSVLESEGQRFVDRCERAFGRFGARFGAELSGRELVPSKLGRDGWR